MLLDSNSIIYSIKPEFAKLRQLIAAQSPAVLMLLDTDFVLSPDWN